VKKEKNNIQRPFLAYANHSLKDNPKNLHKIFDSIEHHITMPNVSRTYIRSMVDTIIELSEHNDPKIIKKNKPIPEEELRFSERDNVSILDSISDMKTIISIATDAVYGYRNGFCENRCYQRDLMIQKFGEDIFSGPERPKCYECNQIFFTHMLSILVEGREYSQIPYLMCFLNNSHEKLKTELQITSAPSRAIVREQLEEIVVFRAEDRAFFGAIAGGTPMIYRGIFRDFLYSFVANDLTEFLLGKDTQDRPNRMKLKKCPECRNFFAGRLNKEYCSKDCYNKAYHRKYMQEKRDPEGSKYDERYKTREFG